MTRVERSERRSEIPLLFLALAFVVAYAWPVIHPRMDPDLRTILTTLSWTVWVAFAGDFVVRLVLAEQRWSYTRRHWYDAALIALPMLRPLRLLRLLALARILNRSATSSLVGRVSAYVAGAALMAVALGSIAVLDAEQDRADANITSYGDALWWAATTVTTVGYGDRYPVTTQGRLIAVALMVVGIALVGAVTASVAAWMVAQVASATAVRKLTIPVMHLCDSGDRTPRHINECTSRRNAASRPRHTFDSNEDRRSSPIADVRSDAETHYLSNVPDSGSACAQKPSKTRHGVRPRAGAR